jgi:hypothetical protein
MLITTDSNEPWHLAFGRRCLMLLCTWLMAHIYFTLDDLRQIVDGCLSEEEEAERRRERNSATASAGEAALGTNEALPPASGTNEALQAGRRLPRAAKPTLKAGYSLPYAAPGTQATHAWTHLGAEAFNVRCGPDYPRNGFKAPSGPSLGEVVAMDGLRTETKIFDFLSLNHIELPEPTPGWSEVYPEFLVVNQMMPAKFLNSIFTSDKTDGETLNLITYVRLRPGMAREYTVDRDPQNAQELLKRFILLAGQDPGVAHCFKEIGVVRNLEELASSLPSSLYGLLAKYNGKPVLTRPEHFFHRDPQNRYFAIDLDGHRYKYFTRTALSAGLSHVERLKLGYGYVVEARKEQELPEVMLGCCEVLMYQKSLCVDFPPSAA